jgi:hypothetical protein
MLPGFSGCTAQTLLAYWRALPTKKLEETVRPPAPSRHKITRIYPDLA